MIDKLIDLAIKQRFLTLLLGAALVAYGVYAMGKLNVDAFPDVTNIQVQVNTAAPGLAAEEVEKLITFPIESVMNGLPDVTEVRSISKTGLSVVTVVFADHVDIYFARQLVLERLQAAKERIPDGLAAPEMGPITTGLGQIFKYVLVGEGRSSMELRTLNDSLVKLQLRTVPGVTDVLSFGGEVKQYQVRVDPAKLLEYHLSLEDVHAALGANNANAGGWYIEGDQEQLVVRGVGLLAGGDEGLADIGRVVLRTVDGTPISVKDVATVGYGGEIRQGAVTMDGHGEVVMGIVLQLTGANTKRVIDGVRQKIASLQTSLPAGVTIMPVYDQANLVDKAVSTVTDALAEAGVLIVIVLLLFLWNVRSALVVICAIPFSLMVAIVMMHGYGLSANLQSLGGLAIGIGMMVDGSIVMVENFVRHLAERSAESVPTRLFRAASEVGRPVFFAVVIIVVVFLPLFTLEGVEGKLFRPMAFTIAFAMIGSLVAALALVPALSTFLLRPTAGESHGALMHVLERAYRPALRWSVGHPKAVTFAAIVAFAGAMATVPFLGTEFVPELDEGTMSIRITMNPSISLAESMRIATRLERRIVAHPEVTHAFSQIGRPELGGDPEPIANNEISVGLKPQSEWTTVHDRGELIAKLSEELGREPGVVVNFSQPIAARVDELLSGVKAQIAIKLFGDDLAVLERKGGEIQAVVQRVPGATDVQMEQVSGEAQLEVRADREALARYGLNVADVMAVVSSGVGGESATQVIEGQRRFDVQVRLAEEHRNSPEAIGNLLVGSGDGLRVPLSQVAAIRIVHGPPTVSREAAQRRVVVQCNVRGRDMGGFVAAAQEAVKARVDLPPGYLLTWGGQFENQQRAQRKLMIVVPLSLGLIFLLLHLSFESVRNALLIILNVPFALVGGVFALALTHQYLSVPASVGFIALFGVAVLNGVVMVSYFNQLVREGLPLGDAVSRGALQRLRPVLMTATVASLGLVPLLLSRGIGSEVQRPLATVVVGGLTTSTLLTLFVLPAIYRWFAEKRVQIEI